MSNKFEKSLWSVRYITILPVLLSIISSVALLVLGGWEIIEAIIFYNPLFDDSITNYIIEKSPKEGSKLYLTYDKEEDKVNVTGRKTRKKTK